MKHGSKIFMAALLFTQNTIVLQQLNRLNIAFIVDNFCSFFCDFNSFPLLSYSLFNLYFLQFFSDNVSFSRHLGLSLCRLDSAEVFCFFSVVRCLLLWHFINNQRLIHILLFLSRPLFESFDHDVVSVSAVSLSK